MSKPSSIVVVVVVAVDTTVTGAGGVGVAVRDGVTVVAVPDVPEPGLWEMTAAEAAGAAIAQAIPSAHPESHHSLAKRAAPSLLRLSGPLISMERPAPPASAFTWIIHLSVNGADIRRKEPAVSSIAHRGFVHLGMDVSKDSIAVAVLSPDRDVAEVDKIFHDTDSVRRLVKRLGKPEGDLGLLRGGPDRL